MSDAVLFGLVLVVAPLVAWLLTHLTLPKDQR